VRALFMSKRSRPIIGRVAPAVLAGTLVLVGSPAAAAPGGPDLAVSGASHPGVVSPLGGQVLYALTVANVGSATVRSAVLTDVAPAGATFVAGRSDACWQVATGGQLTCALGDVAVGASLVRRIVFTTPTAEGVITNVAGVMAKKDTNPTNDSAATSTTVRAANGTEAGGYLGGGEGLTLDTVGGVHRFALPPGNAAVVATIVRSDPRNICDGPCESEAITIDFPFQHQPVVDVDHPAVAEIVFEGLTPCGGLGQLDCHPLYYQKGSGPGLLVPFCEGAQAGKAGSGRAYADRPCINDQSRSSQEVRRQVLFLTEDPTFGGR
jgi:uncharacterized repeat protein (TIGR01451 family)